MHHINHQNSQLKNFIHIESNIIPDNVCDETIRKIECNQWYRHTWYDNANEISFSNELKELDIQEATEEIQQMLIPYMMHSIQKYNTQYHFNSKNTKHIVSKFSNIRFNRYNKHQMMRQHHDHIHSLFDGYEKGIPVLSLILNLNDNYHGGDLIFWKDYKVSLSKGDIVIFPSLFLFPHMVTEIIDGIRYSAVSWSF